MMKKVTLAAVALLCLLISPSTMAKGKNKKEKVEDKKSMVQELSISGLKFRSIGPALTGGRIAVLAVDPSDHDTYFVGSGHGNLWKTSNHGVTFAPVFDNQGAYAIGAITIDPTNSNVVWVGTGENNCQSNAGYGDGVYKSQDGGKTWKNIGLKESEHIGGVVIDPRHPDTVFVAAYGSQRRAGGDRGIYKTTDGGKAWEKVLNVSDYTGFFEIHMDPRDPDLLYASAHQRMRKHYTNVYGGPESGIYRSTDGGANWEKLTNGLPKGDMGRIGMAISPVNPDVVYALVQAGRKEKGFYKSTDRGMSWSKQSGYMSSYPFYFQRIFADPQDVNRVYSVDVFMQVTEDGGKSFHRAGSNLKHVDDHCLWIDPTDTKHLLAGCDGGVYESYDRASTWTFKSNLPIAEIYKITTDNAKPFYNVYIGTQDNNSLTGPSQTISSGGITNQDWLFTNSGDGFETQVDWKDPNIVYAQSQNGGLVRFDKRSGENLFIKPFEFAGPAYRFDWDAALLISKHDHKRLYFGGNKVLRTNDQGSTWEEISPDLTRGVPQEMEKIMGQSWSIDQLVAKGSMANIVTIAESPIDEKVLFAGSGDGLIHYTLDGGANWNLSKTPGLPEYARIHQIIASNFDVKTAYAACHDMIGGDYRPFLMKTMDGGQSWSFINGDLPERGSTYSIAEDHVNQNLLFVGTQFGVFFSVDGGKEWIQFKSGIPNHCVMDMEIQREQNDLVVSTFGRGIYILDDYSPLRDFAEDNLKKDAYMFPIKEARMFIPSNPFGFRGVGFMGADFYTASNPPNGAVFTYYVKDEFKTLKETRREQEKELQKEKKTIKHPTYEALREESEEPESFLLFVVSDNEGNVVRRLKTGISKGVKRLVWDFRTDAVAPVSLKTHDNSVPWNEPDKGFMVVPGTYQVAIKKCVQGVFTDLIPPQSFECVPLGITSMPAKDKDALAAFNIKVAELTRVVLAADQFRDDLQQKLAYFKKAVMTTDNQVGSLFGEIIELEKSLAELNRELNGDGLLRRFEGATPTSIRDRVELITGALWSTTAAPTATFKKSYDVAADNMDSVLQKLKQVEDKTKVVEEKLETLGAPYTPGRFPQWKK